MTNANMTTRPFDPEQLAETNPYDYVWVQGFHRDPDLQETTDTMLESIVSTHPAAFFEFRFNRVPEFIKYAISAAKNLLLEDPLSYVLVYRLNHHPEFNGLLPMLFESLSNFLGFKDGEEYQKNPRLFKEVDYIVELLSKFHREYYLNSGLAEDVVFGKHLANVGKKALVLNRLVRLANSIDQVNTHAADCIDQVIKAELELPDSRGHNETKEPPQEEAQAQASQLASIKCAVGVATELVKLSKQHYIVGSEKAATIIRKAANLILLNLGEGK